MHPGKIDIKDYTAIFLNAFFVSFFLSPASFPDIAFRIFTLDFLKKLISGMIQRTLVYDFSDDFIFFHPSSLPHRFYYNNLSSKGQHIRKKKEEEKARKLLPFHP